MAFKPIDPKRDEYRRYLEKNGVIEALTKVFVRMARERPEQPLDYMRDHIGDSQMQTDTLTYLQEELQEARSEIQRLRTLIKSIDPSALENDAADELTTVTEVVEKPQSSQQQINNNSADNAALTVNNNTQSQEQLDEKQKEKSENIAADTAVTDTTATVAAAAVGANIALAATATKAENSETVEAVKPSTPTAQNANNNTNA